MKRNCVFAGKLLIAIGAGLICGQALDDYYLFGAVCVFVGLALYSAWWELK